MKKIIYLLPLILIMACQKVQQPNLNKLGFFTRYSNLNEITGPVITTFESNVNKVLIVRRNATESSADYGVIVPTNEKPYALFFPFGKPNATVNSGACEISTYTLIKILGGVHINNAIRSGSWTSNAGATLYGGSYRTSSSINGYAQFTTSDSCSRIGVYDIATTSASGFMKVTIDNDPTLANHIPTAQQFVNAGTLSASCLIANGGLLNPTDRLLYNKNPGTSAIIPSHSDNTYYTTSRRLNLASGLTPGIHTVRFTILPYSAVGSSVLTVRLNGIWFENPNVNITNTGVGFEPLTNPQLTSTGSDNNFAFSFTPLNLLVSQAEWMGHAGSQFKSQTMMYKNNVLLSAVPQGNYTHLTDEFKLTVIGYCKHSLIGKVADYTQDFIFSAKDGVYINTIFKWVYPGTATGYLPQLAVNEPINKATAWEATQNYLLTNNDESYKYNQDATSGYIWNPTSNWAMLCAIADTANLLIQDRSGGIINKLYFRRYNQTPINIGDSIKCTALYRFKKLNNADFELSK